MQPYVNRQNHVWVAHSDINSYYNPASPHRAGLLTGLQSWSWESPPGSFSGLAEMAAFGWAARLSPCHHLLGFPCDEQAVVVMLVSHELGHLRAALAARCLRRCLVKSSCARGKAWLTMDFGSQPWGQHIFVRSLSCVFRDCWSL